MIPRPNGALPANQLLHVPRLPRGRGPPKWPPRRRAPLLNAHVNLPSLRVRTWRTKTPCHNRGPCLRVRTSGVVRRWRRPRSRGTSIADHLLEMLMSKMRMVLEVRLFFRSKWHQAEHMHTPPPGFLFAHCTCYMRDFSCVVTCTDVDTVPPLDTAGPSRQRASVRPKSFADQLSARAYL